MWGLYSPLPVAAYIRIIRVQSLSPSGQQDQQQGHYGNREAHCTATGEGIHRDCVFWFESHLDILP